jgi:hypothetical protein
MISLFRLARSLVKSAAAAVLLFTSLLVACQTSAPSTAAFAEPVPSHTSVPIALDVIPGLPVVEVRIQNQTCLLSLNTGMADHISLKPRVLDRLDCTELDSRTLTCDINGRLTRASQYLVGDIDIQGITITEAVVSQELRSFFPELIDGSIGRSFLSEFTVLFDYPNARAELFDSLGEAIQAGPNEWMEIPFSLDERGIVIDGAVTDSILPASLCLDTGCALPIDGIYYGAIQADSVGRLELETVSEPTSPLWLVSGGFNVGDTWLGELSFVVDDYRMPFDAIIGANFLEGRRVVIDFAGETLYVEKP